MATAKPSSPPIDTAWEAANPDLHRNVKDALAALPTYFRTETHISGIMAPDLFTLNSVLGAAIEEQTVATLNSMRQIWDPAGKYALFSFVRQSQTFPDVLLRSAADGAILLGIELKGWYLLAREGEPSLRFYTTAAACSLQDLIVVVPWALSNVISGSPNVYTPFVASARYCALYRNYWWEHVRNARDKAQAGIAISTHKTPYPAKADAISDAPNSDKGGNFGRLARTEIMDGYVKEMMGRPLCGVKARHWLKFLQAIQEKKTDEDFQKAVAEISTEIEKSAAGEGQRALLLEMLENIKLLGEAANG